jgi:hypothetical protein
LPAPHRKADISTPRVIEGWLEFEAGGLPGSLESGLPPTLVYRLEETLAEIDEDVDRTNSTRRSSG